MTLLRFAFVHGAIFEPTKECFYIYSEKFETFESYVSRTYVVQLVISNNCIFFHRVSLNFLSILIVIKKQLITFEHNFEPIFH